MPHRKPLVSGYSIKCTIGPFSTARNDMHTRRLKKNPKKKRETARERQHADNLCVELLLLFSSCCSYCTPLLWPPARARCIACPPHQTRGPARGLCGCTHKNREGGRVCKRKKTKKTPPSAARARPRRPPPPRAPAAPRAGSTRPPCRPRRGFEAAHNAARGGGPPPQRPKSQPKPPPWGRRAGGARAVTSSCFCRKRLLYAAPYPTRSPFPASPRPRAVCAARNAT